MAQPSVKQRVIEAVNDVEAIKAYVACDSVRYATLLAERIVAAVDRLESFPESGRVVTGLACTSHDINFTRRYP